MAASVHAEDAAGNWFGAIDGHTLTFVHIEKGADGLSGYVDLHELPADPGNHNDHRALENLSATPDQLSFHFTTAKSGATFNGTWDATKNAWVGKAAWNGGHKATLSLWRTSAATLATAKMPPPKEVNDPAALDKIAKAYVDNGTFMGAVLVARGDRILLDKGYGFANLELKVPNTPHARFMIGSISKQFTAASILMLEEQGKLKTDDPVGKYIPDVPDAWKSITLHNLLTHTSGIPDFFSSDRGKTAIGQPVMPDEIISDAERRPLDFPPNSRFAYSNTNYTLLARIVEIVSGVTYTDFVQSRIFTPLGMKETSLPGDIDIVPSRAAGYGFGTIGLENQDYEHSDWLFGAGGIVSTTHDLLLWERALIGGKVLKPETVTRMTTPYKANYGYGVGQGPMNGYAVIEHAGAFRGFTSDMAYFPDDKLTVIVLANVEGLAPGRMWPKLAMSAHGESVELPPARTFVAVSQDILKTYVGSYQINDNTQVKIFVRNQKLVLAAADFEHDLTALSDTKFFSVRPEVNVDFVKDADGKVSMTYDRDGMKVTAPRKD